MTATCQETLTKTIDALEPGEKAYTHPDALWLNELHEWLLHPKTPVSSIPLLGLCVEVVKNSDGYVVRLYGEGAWVYQPRYLKDPDLPLDKWLRPNFVGCRS